MLKVPVYSIKATKLSDFSLPKKFGEKVNLKLLAQAIRVYEDRVHGGLAKVKTRAEVNRTKKKWYRQKGTGGARHGAKSAPIFVGGGVAHGPKGVKRQLVLPEKMRQKAKMIAFSAKLANKELILVDGMEKLKKTKEAASLLAKLGKITSAKKFSLVFGDKAKEATKALENLENAQVIYFTDINAYQIFSGGMIVMDRKIFGGGK